MFLHREFTSNADIFELTFELGTISVMNEVIAPGSNISVIVVQRRFVIFVATRLVIHKHVKISEDK